MRKKVTMLLALAVALSGAAYASPDKKNDDKAKPAASGTPPGLAKKGGVPPGLAKHFGAAVPARAYIAIDPRHDDRAWFLIDDRWVLKQDLTPDARAEMRHLISLPTPPLPEPPPIPLPSLDAPLRILHFG